MNKVQHQNEHFGSISEEYYKARQNKKHLYYKQLLFQYVLRNACIDIKQKITVLEPMCGYGEGEKIVRRYITDNIEYEGFDYSSKLIQKVKEKRPEINIYKQDITNFCPVKKYDIIILLGGLHHVPDYSEQVCKTLAGALREGGLFINFEPTNNNFFVDLIRKIIYKKNHIFDEQTERAFSLKELNGMYKNAGLKIKEQYFPGLLGYILYYNPDAFPALNRGSKNTVKRIVAFEKKYYNNWFGRFFSFCTFSIMEKT